MRKKNKNKIESTVYNSDNLALKEAIQKKSQTLQNHFLA